MKKNICVLILFFVFSFTLTSQEKIRYGNIPYGISIEEAIKRYSSIYDTCKEETYSYFFNCTFIDFTALRPMFQNIFGDITTFSMGYTSAWKKFDDGFTRILLLGEEYTLWDGRTAYEYTNLYFIKDREQSKLFMVSRRGGVEKRGDVRETYLNNKSVVTDLLKMNPRELSGTYDYYSSGSCSVRAYGCIWEKNNERVVLYAADDIGNTGGFIYINNPLWREYENLYINKRNSAQNTAMESARNQF
jgi:hypothetical protein